MLDLERNMINVNGQSSLIKEWKVWFWTINGLWPNLEDAVFDAKKHEMPLELIRAVPVAIGLTGIYEPILK